MSVISAHELAREYAPGRGLCGVSFDVKAGECFCILGRNGAGKSTLARLILGLEPPSSGSLSVMGHRASRRSKKVLSSMGAALDRSTHWDRLSGWDNAYFVARSYGLAGRVVTRRLSRLFHVADLRDQAMDPVSTYSYGMLRKLSIIQAMAHKPDLLVLDEATTGVDIYFISQLTELIRKRSVEGQATLIAGNDIEWISEIADRVAFLDAGKMIAMGTVEAMVREVSPFQKVSITLSGPSPIHPCEMKGLRSIKQNGKAIHALLEPDPLLLPLLLENIISSGGVIDQIEVRQSSLRDAFFLKTGHTLDQ